MRPWCSTTGDDIGLVGDEQMRKSEAQPITNLKSQI
jgi:hypothetical protein